MRTRNLFTLGAALFTAACSSSPTTPAADAGGDASTPADAATASDAAADAAPDLCDPAPRASKCMNESSWVRGVARFDPTHFGKGTKPVLRIALRHPFVLVPGEEKIGGRLHSFVSIPITDASAGKVPFAIDMCGLGTAMWSEENGTFHLVMSIDENGNNDLYKATTNENAITIATPDVGELTKRVDVDVSCHAPSACVDVALDCSSGATCTTITPIDACSKKDPSCPSEDIFCN
jgi:hypothetical protein